LDNLLTGNKLLNLKGIKDCFIFNKQNNLLSVIN